MPWLVIGQTDVYYSDQGEGPPLVFLHGFTSCGEAWFQQFEHFAPRYRVIAYDSVNHGHSSNSPRDAEEPDRVDELDAVLDALEVERPVLLGNSMGGGTLLRWAARHPDRAAALVPSGCGVSAEPLGERTEPNRGGAPAAVREPLPQDVLLLPIGDSLTDRLRRERPLMYERYLRIRSTATSIENRRHPRRRSAAALEEGRHLHARVTGIRSPMLVIVGSLDRAVPRAEELHKQVSHSEYRVIEGAPHNVYYEAAAEYNALVDEFLLRTL